jgi:hypothetical protein
MVSSLAELQDKINSFSMLENETRLFRGQSCASWNLESGLFRSLREKGQIEESLPKKNLYTVERIKPINYKVLNILEKD